MEQNKFSEKIIKSLLKEDVKKFKFLEFTDNINLRAVFQYNNQNIYIEAAYTNKDLINVEEVIREVRINKEEYERVINAGKVAMKTYIDNALRSKYRIQIIKMQKDIYLAYCNEILENIEKTLESSKNKSDYISIYKYYIEQFEFNKFIEEIEISLMEEEKYKG